MEEARQFLYRLKSVRVSLPYRMKILNIPGLDNYVELKKDYRRAQRLLKEPEANREELSIILDRFNSHYQARRLLELEFKDRFTVVYNRLKKLFPPKPISTLKTHISPLKGINQYNNNIKEEIYYNINKDDLYKKDIKNYEYYSLEEYLEDIK